MIPVRFHHLRAMGLSPAHAKALIDGDEATATGSMRMGSGTHAMCFRTHPVVEYLGVRRGKAWEEFQAEHVGSLILTTAEYERSLRMYEAVQAHELGAGLLSDGNGNVRETSIYWNLSGRECRGTPDVANYATRVVELKTTVSADPVRFARQSMRFAYHASLAWYLDGIAATGRGTPSSAYVVAVESAAPYPVTVLKLTERAIEKGRALYRLWFEQLINCERSGSWPGYAQGVVDLDIPDDFELSYGDDIEAA